MSNLEIKLTSSISGTIKHVEVFGEFVNDNQGSPAQRQDAVEDARQRAHSQLDNIVDSYYGLVRGGKE